MRYIRHAASAGALTVLAVGAATVFSPVASAAPNVTPQSVCGSAYKTVNSAAVGSLGTIYLTYNSANGKNCVTTIRSNPGTAKDMSTYIYVADTGEWADDYGRFTSYAGPSYVYAKNFCVSWGGHIDNISVSVDNTNCASLKEHRVTEIR
ncbi:spore-associated protein [Streptomyces sp. NPDC093085]|uniref:spore-associated protein n=1 Tax=Streptomyces sp. NPDC093085 TaxID=3155068 RepID=UPI0034419BA2